MDGKIYIADSNNNRIQIFGYRPKVYLSLGLNTFGCIGNIPQNYNSYNLMNALGTADELQKIQKYNSVNHTYETTIYENGLPGGDKFSIVSGEGYLVYLNVEKSIALNNGIENHSLSLQAGLNIVTLPFTSTSYDFLLYLGSPDEIGSIQHYNRKTGQMETTLYFYGKPSGIKFKIVSGEAYLIHMKVAKLINFYK